MSNPNPKQLSAQERKAIEQAVANCRTGSQVIEQMLDVIKEHPEPTPEVNALLRRMLQSYQELLIPSYAVICMMAAPWLYSQNEINEVTN